MEHDSVLPAAVALPHKKPSRAAPKTMHLSQTVTRRSLISSGLLGAPRSPYKSKAQQPRDEKSDMAASFLQFCAMCEKQIAVPNNSLLYCSESCRRKDSCKPLSASLPGSTVPSAAPSPPSSVPSSPRFILAPLMPTAAPCTRSLNGRIPFDHHEHKSDLDPTEWKPKIHRRGQSEALRYLSQFHHAAGLSDSSSHCSGEQSVDGIAELDYNRRRSFVSRGSTTSTSGASVPGTPGLSQSPLTVSSSFSSYVGHELLQQDSAHRPLPPRQKSFCSGSLGTGLGLDLVTPYCATSANGVGNETSKTTGMDIDCSGIFWEKWPVKQKVTFHADTVSRDTSSTPVAVQGLGQLLREVK